MQSLKTKGLPYSRIGPKVFEKMLMYLLTESDMPCYPGFVVESRTDGDPIPIRSTLGYSAEQRDGLKVFGRSQIKVSTIGTKKFEAVSEGELGADYHFLSLENGSTPLIRRGAVRLRKAFDKYMLVTT